MDRCFMTNWFIGFVPKQIGKFLKHRICPSGCPPFDAKCSICRYEEKCRKLIIDQIRVLEPKAILLLGKEVTRRAHNIAPCLKSWGSVKGSSFFRGVDAIGAVASNVLVPAASLHTNFVALLHPSDYRNHVHRGNPMPAPPKGIERDERKKAGREFEIGLIKNSLK